MVRQVWQISNVWKILILTQYMLFHEFNSLNIDKVSVQCKLDWTRLGSHLADHVLPSLLPLLLLLLSLGAGLPPPPSPPPSARLPRGAAGRRPPLMAATILILSSATAEASPLEGWSCWLIEEQQATDHRPRVLQAR